MKKNFFFLILLVGFSICSSYAQTKKGNVLLGLSPVISMSSYGSDMGFLSFSTIKYKNDNTDVDGNKMTNIGLTPKVGFFVIDNLAIGLDVNVLYGTEKSKGTLGDSKSTSTYLAAGPFIRYYIPLEKVIPFIELNSSFGQSVYKSDYNSETFDNKVNITSLGGFVGLAIPIGEMISFDIAGGYNSQILKDPEDNPLNARTVLGTFGFRFGVVVFLGKNED